VAQAAGLIILGALMLACAHPPCPASLDGVEVRVDGGHTNSPVPDFRGQYVSVGASFYFNTACIEETQE